MWQEVELRKSGPILSVQTRMLEEPVSQSSFRLTEALVLRAIQVSRLITGNATGGKHYPASCDLEQELFVRAVANGIADSLQPLLPVSEA
jgi:hypothetical protein